MMEVLDNFLTLGIVQVVASLGIVLMVVRSYVAVIRGANALEEIRDELQMLRHERFKGFPDGT